MKNTLLLLISLTLCGQLYGEEIRYIGDTLYVPLRSGQSLQHRIVHKGLPSGARLILLESNKDSGYTHVRTEKGLDGWVQSQYLSTQPAARDLYQRSQKTVVKLKQQNTELKQKLNAVKTQYQSSQKNISDLTKQSTSVNTELSNIKKISANSISINSDNKKLLEENQVLKNQVDILEADNQHLQSLNESDSFLNGAFAVLIGVIITLLIPRLVPKKNSGWA